MGQEEAADAVARALRRSSAGISNPDRPIASMLFRYALATSLLAFGTQLLVLSADVIYHQRWSQSIAKLQWPDGYWENGDLQTAGGPVLWLDL